VPAFITALQVELPRSVLQTVWWVGDWTLIVEASQLPEVATWLRDASEAAFDFCSDVTATDWPPRAARFDVIYNLYSIRHRHRVRLKVRIGEADTVPTITGVWPAANWLEREVFDMFGIRFDGHPDLRRILMPEDWQGHPERKDYPLEGPGELLMESPSDLLRAQRDREIE
jgi:NADH-quinone oxidoreductase subunit C